MADTSDPFWKDPEILKTVHLLSLSFARRYGSGIDPSDLESEVFVRLVHFGADRFRSVSEEERKAYLRGLVLSVARGMMRSQRFASGQEHLFKQIVEERGEAAVQDGEQLDKLRKAISNLSDADQLAIRNYMAHGVRAVGGRTPAERAILRKKIERTIARLRKEMDSSGAILATLTAMGERTAQNRKEVERRPARLVLKLTVPPMSDTPENRQQLRERVKELVLAMNRVHLRHGGSGLKVRDVKVWLSEGAKVPAGGIQ